MLESKITIELKLALSKKLDCPPYIYHSTNRLFGEYSVRYSFCWFKPVSRGLQLRLVCILLIDSCSCSKYRIVVIETALLVRHVIA